MTKSPLFPFTCALFLLLIFALTKPFLFYNATISMPPGWYWCTPLYTNIQLQPGTIVFFVPTVDITETLLSRPEFQTRQEEVFRPWLKQVVRQDFDNLYVQGTHPRSLDSRQFGPIPRTSVQKTCISLFIWKGSE